MKIGTSVDVLCHHRQNPMLFRALGHRSKLVDSTSIMHVSSELLRWLEGIGTGHEDRVSVFARLLPRPWCWSNEPPRAWKQFIDWWLPGMVESTIKSGSDHLWRLGKSISARLCVTRSL